MPLAAAFLEFARESYAVILRVPLAGPLARGVVRALRGGRASVGGRHTTEERLQLLMAAVAGLRSRLDDQAWRLEALSAGDIEQPEAIQGDVLRLDILDEPAALRRLASTRRQLGPGGSVTLRTVDWEGVLRRGGLRGLQAALWPGKPGEPTVRALRSPDEVSDLVSSCGFARPLWRRDGDDGLTAELKLQE